MLQGRIVRIRDLASCERSRTKTHETTVYLPNIRQVTPPVHAVFVGSAEKITARVPQRLRLWFAGLHEPPRYCVQLIVHRPALCSLLASLNWTGPDSF